MLGMKNAADVIVADDLVRSHVANPCASRRHGRKLRFVHGSLRSRNIHSQCLLLLSKNAHRLRDAIVLIATAAPDRQLLQKRFANLVGPDSRMHESEQRCSSKNGNQETK